VESAFAAYPLTPLLIFTFFSILILFLFISNIFLIGILLSRLVTFSTLFIFSIFVVLLFIVFAVFVFFAYFIVLVLLFLFKFRIALCFSVRVNIEKGFAHSKIFTHFGMELT
jgi:hypothetical protein